MHDEPPPFPVVPLADCGTTPPRDGTPPFTIVVDTREQTPLAFPANVPLVRAGLRTGDYSIAGHEDQFTVERKTLADLVHTIIHERQRFERELARMRVFAFRRVVCTASMDAVRRGKYLHSMANPKAVVASIAAFEIRYDVPFVFSGSSDEAARRIVDWARYFIRERALRNHESMLADRAADRAAGVIGTAPHPPGIGSFQALPTRKPTGRDAEFEVIPTKVHEGVKRCKAKKVDCAQRCKAVPNPPGKSVDERGRDNGANT